MNVRTYAREEKKRARDEKLKQQENERMATPRLRYRNLWPGIDVVFHGSERGLEYDVIVAAGADPSLAR